MTVVNERILLGEDLGLAEHLSVGLSKVADAPDVVGFTDGAELVAAFVRLVNAGQPPQLVILDTALARISGHGTALAVRAIERGLGAQPAAILLYTADSPDDALRHLLASLGRAVHLQRPADLSPKDQGKRLAVAVERLMAQLKGQ